MKNSATKSISLVRSQQATGAEIFVVGVGRSVNSTELVEIASEPSTKYLHRFDLFGSIRLKSLEIGDDVECGESPPDR